MDEVAYERAGVRVVWESPRRLFFWIYGPHARPRNEDALVLQSWMDERTGSGAPFLVLVDHTHADVATVAWRYRWVSWFYARRARVRVAIFGADQLGRTMLDAFRLSTRTEIRAFPNESAARAWLMAAHEDEPSAPRSL